VEKIFGVGKGTERLFYRSGNLTSNSAAGSMITLEMLGKNISTLVMGADLRVKIPLAVLILPREEG